MFWYQKVKCHKPLRYTRKRKNERDIEKVPEISFRVAENGKGPLEKSVLKIRK